MLLLSAIVAVTAFEGLTYADTCSFVEDLTSIEVARPLQLAYVTEQNEYWSESCTLLKPSCIIFPSSAQEVAAVVKILRDTDEDFAVKSGGHNPNLYCGWTFVGGRIGNTGIGGLILGGGLSYMSTQYGWSASSVIEHEVVLSNGTIVAASADENPDLFTALKGGGNNFGIGDVYGGNLLFLRSEETDEKLLKAVRDFTEYNEDDKAAVIVTAERINLNLLDSWILFLFYDGTEVPEGIFKNFTDVGPVLNTLRVRSYSSMMKLSNWVVVEASTVHMATETIPLPSAENGTEVFNSIHVHWRAMSRTTLAVPGIVASTAYQPFPRRIAEAARARGDDLIAADPDVDRLIIEMNYSFLPGPFEEMADTMEETYTGVRERVLAWQEDGTLPSHVYLPLSINYGFYRQDYFARLKPESAALARDVSARYDPEGLFRDRTGGWKP
ncbi:Bifunctional solanapyrone synthase-like protein [Hapsidospora chrysogenum ATCC 11550]|uniref:Bifunctional solanapyrone synthase-like protein n=1 Tax=Hapsidospora chrysogenum (strain ATCC 11550 / CBS 779.69 / DSM 880 / IAM 14645 / JCM 23072 / IMI 49137) TaxID=857340 RepID=A0A086T1I5_HAPC1|nr:Bifunctional solanapyrone synthase-like protein [Hapsidospora chrysogenum ATCC 11550]